MKWVLIKVNCENCGREITAKFFETKPSEAEIREETTFPFCAKWELIEIPE